MDEEHRTLLIEALVYRLCYYDSIIDQCIHHTPDPEDYTFFQNRYDKITEILEKIQRGYDI